MFKKVFVCVICLVILFSLQGTCFADTTVYDYTNGNSYVNPTAEALMNRAVAKHQGSFRFIPNNNNEELTPDKNSYFSNSEIRIPLRLITDLLNYNVPLGFISQAFGVNIIWDTNTKSGYIETKPSH